MSDLQNVSVSCTSLSETILQKAHILAKKLGISYCSINNCPTPFILTYTDERLELRQNPGNSNSQQLFNPLVVDFLTGKSGYRYAKNLTIKQPLAKAVGIKSGFRPEVFDATAGLGGDGFALACLGCQVILNERSPIIGSLLSDGLSRAAADSAAGNVVKNHITLYQGDARNSLTKLDRQIHTIFLDPMYPHSTKSALNKREMRILREIVGDDSDSHKLFATAIQYAANRIVVKRPKDADFLAGRPSHAIAMKSGRFDIYLTAHL